MTKLNELELVIGLACLTEDRSPDEQRAMLATALRLDSELGSFASTNRTPQRPRWVREVEQTYHPDNGRRVGLTGVQLRSASTLAERWEDCTRCIAPQGMHYADDKCPSLPHDLERARRIRDEEESRVGTA